MERPYLPGNQIPSSCYDDDIASVVQESNSRKKKKTKQNKSKLINQFREFECFNFVLGIFMFTRMKLSKLALNSLNSWLCSAITLSFLALASFFQREFNSSSVKLSVGFFEEVTA